MATQATRGVGNKLYVGSPPVLVAEVLNLTPFALSASQIDVTNQDSVAKEFISDLPDFGTCSFDMNFLPSDVQQRQFIDDLQDGTARAYQIRFSDSPQTVADFEAIVVGFAPSANIGEQLKASVSLKLTGAVTFQEPS